MGEVEGVSRKTVVLYAIVVVATGLGGMTQNALNTMEALVLADFGTDLSYGQLLTTLYMLSMGVVVPLASYLNRRFSVRTLICAALSCFLCGSVCDMLAINFPMLLIGRVLEAGATGVLMPLLQTIAMTRFPASKHGTAMGIAGISLGFAPNVGPTIGGALITVASWRFLFVILAGISALLLVATLAGVKERDVADAHARLESRSLAYVALAFCGLQLGFTNAASWHLAHPFVWAPVVLGALFLVMFLKRQRKVNVPLIDLRVFEQRPFRVALLAQCLLYGCTMGMSLAIPLFVIEGCGHSAVEAGLVLFPGALVALVCEPSAGAASDRFGARRVCLFGGALLLVGALGAALVPADAPLWVPAFWQAVRCAGMTTLIPTTTSYGLSALGKSGLTPDGSSVLIMSRQLATSLSTAVMVLLITAFAMATPLGAALGYHLAFGFSALLGAGVLVCSCVFVREKN